VRDIVLDLTQTQLAEKTNTKQKSVSRYETGASLPSIKNLGQNRQSLEKTSWLFFRGVKWMCSNPPFYLLKGAIPAIIPELFDGFNKIYPI